MKAPAVTDLPPLEDAKRYLANARQILAKKALLDKDYYLHRKYVKLAGETAYMGVVKALDSLFQQETTELRDADWYAEKVVSFDSKLVNTFISANYILDTMMAYDGVQDAEVVSIGLERANTIIDWVETRLAQQA